MRQFLIFHSLVEPLKSLERPLRLFVQTLKVSKDKIILFPFLVNNQEHKKIMKHGLDSEQLSRIIFI